MRSTQKHLQAKVDILNDMLGANPTAWNVIGTIRLYRAYGATGVDRVMSTSGGVTSLMELGTVKEASQFLSGMIAALRIAGE